MKSANSRDGAGEAAPGSTQSQQKGSPKTQKKAKPSAQPLRRSRRIISNKTDGIVAGSSVVDVVEISEDAPSINSAVIVSTGAVEDAQSSDDSDVPLTKSRRRSIVNVIVIESSSDEADDTRGVCDNGSKVTNVCQEDRELRSKSDSIVVSGVDAKSAGERDAHSGSAADNGVSMAENGVSDDDSGGLGSRRRAGQIKRNRLESSSGESAVVSDAVVITGEEISNGVSTGKATAKRQGKRTRQIRHQIDISSEEAESVSDTNMANGHKISKSAGEAVNADGMSQRIVIICRRWRVLPNYRVD
ncbi:hypothetical protein SARC_16655 [Sphaeroforma arctica JP610]|uniref:Uncharacterized protein n=1 Tax=Sphaeroforma arctica JP610 TaxID=667725 RepID=A0A0L0F2I0_9EUKA|nr:hypothetical protein SARC_16655 [Sphaeroforma arctica JP610]KNC70814.1 hypothetical protein SARC_16655 [Sphaeroforma arctica JP610]|eukprot:XP_014144716.1 hypothetical protein SARC_16655 [Sphaeroforma arctica JP610]